MDCSPRQHHVSIHAALPLTLRMTLSRLPLSILFPHQILAIHWRSCVPPHLQCRYERSAVGLAGAFHHIAATVMAAW